MSMFMPSLGDGYCYIGLVMFHVWEPGWCSRCDFFSFFFCFCLPELGVVSLLIQCVKVKMPVCCFYFCY